jgi:RNA-directed DNA polymerase
MDKAGRPSVLKKAWEAVPRNKGTAGVDLVKLSAFEAKLEANMSILSRELALGTYNPLPVKSVEIPKGDGKTRTL